MDKTPSFIYETLKTVFGNRSCELDFTNNYELIVSVILSARCTDKRVNLITPELFKKYPTVYDLAVAKNEEVEKIIFSCGFYKNKAKSLISMAKDVVDKFDGEIPDNFEDLTKLSGVGRKTANVVCSVGFKIPAIAVDTHVFRVSNRLGLCDSKTPKECESALQKKFDKNLWGQMHHYLVLFGRYYCKSQNPQCKDCKFKSFCLKQSKSYIDKKY